MPLFFFCSYSFSSYFWFCRVKFLSLFSFLFIFLLFLFSFRFRVHNLSIVLKLMKEKRYISIFSVTLFFTFLLFFSVPCNFFLEVIDSCRYILPLPPHLPLPLSVHFPSCVVKLSISSGARPTPLICNLIILFQVVDILVIFSTSISPLFDFYSWVQRLKEKVKRNEIGKLSALIAIRRDKKTARWKWSGMRMIFFFHVINKTCLPFLSFLFFSFSFHSFDYPPSSSFVPFLSPFPSDFTRFIILSFWLCSFTSSIL